MESKQPVRTEEALGLRLVRNFLLLPPEKRQLVLEFVEQLSRAQERREDAPKVSPP